MTNYVEAGVAALRNDGKIKLYGRDDFAAMQRAGRLTAECLDEIGPMIRPGLPTNEIDRFVYSRYGNPTISMFEERLRLIEGAPAAFATATGINQTIQRISTALAVAVAVVLLSDGFGAGDRGSFGRLFLVTVLSGVGAMILGSRLDTRPKEILR